MSDKRDKALYEQLYEGIRDDILSGKLREGEKLPSKRALAESRRVSVITAENAYSQLIAEGYVRAEQRSGYFVQYSGGVTRLPAADISESAGEPQDEETAPEQSANADLFPFSVWTRLMRSVILEKNTALLRPVTSGGAMELRRAISGYLYRTRGFRHPPERIIIGAGTEYLYNLLIQLLGRDKRYGIEDPAFEKLPKIYALNGVDFEYIPLDESGMSAAELEKRRVDVAHISPAHHFPTGIVMPISRRREIMLYAEQSGSFIIEDDYDSEFHRGGRPVPSMFSLDGAGNVIYVNTFSRTIAPSVRISYMCLPERLYSLWRERLGFYACPVPAFEQYTLARFIGEGYFERHISRSRKRYKRIRELVLGFIARFPEAEVFEENAGLHFTARLSARADEIVSACAECGIKVTPLSDYYANITDKRGGGGDLYVVNYVNACEETLLSRLGLSGGSGIIK